MNNNYSFSRRLALLSFLLVTCFSSFYAQVSNYGFSQSAGTFTPISGGTVLGSNTNDDNNFTNLPIGFTFVYNGTSYTAFSVNNNGFIAMGTTVSSSYAAISGTTNNVVAAFNRDLQGNGSTSEVSYLTQGTAPNRTLTVQWKNVKKYGTNGTGDDYTFKIVLYETTNIVEVHYGTITNNANSATPQVGLRGGAATDFNIRSTSTDWAATTAGGTNTATCTVTSTIFPASGTIFRWTGPPATPPTPVQAAGTPTCSAGTTLTLAGTPATDVTWYWQTTATGTSTATPYSGPYTVMANGTYYARAYNSAASLWSLASSSITVSNFPTATPPAAAVATQDPSCAPAGTTLTTGNPPAGYAYYWQGTVNGGSSMAQVANAASPYTATASGTYYLAAYETASGCWSNTVGTTITVNTYTLAAPTTAVNNYNICSGTTSQPIVAQAGPSPVVLTQQASFGTNLVSTGTGAATFPLTVPALPAGATLTGAALHFTNVNAVNGSWRSEIRVALSGDYTLGATQISNLSSGGLISPDPSVTLAGFAVPAGGAVTLLITETYDDGGATTNDATFGSAELILSYTMPATLNWYNLSAAGTMIGTGSPFETYGTTVMPNTATSGTHIFYAETAYAGCVSATRLPVTVNVTEVLAQLTPVAASCNGAANGTFTLGTVQCGTAPFTYSIDNGVTFTAIPTNLTAGTYQVIMHDAVGGVSSPIQVIITQPTAPQNLAVVDVNYFNGTITWTPQGNETSWIVEYGPAGFTPGTGDSIIATNDTLTITGLTADTDYQFYVTAACGTNSAVAGPVAMNTNPGFYTFDNACGPGFTDISTTGTALNLTDDATTTVTPGFPVSFQGVTSSTVTVSNNGWIQFGGVTLNAWNIDLDDENGNVYQQTVTIGGEQYFIVQWNDRPRFSSVAGQTVTFQLLMRQSTGEVYYVYNDVVFGGTQASNDFGASGTISANGPLANITVSSNNASYLTNNSCVHFYAALCPNPTNLTTQPFQEEAIVDWNAGLYGETNWTIIYGPTGFDPATSGMTLTSTNSDVNILDLTQNTTYDVYVYSECMADDLTSGGLMATFTTLPFCTAPSNITTSTAPDALGAAWNWTENPGYAIDHFNLQYGMTGFELDGPNSMLYPGGANNMDTVNNVAFIGGGVYQVYVQSVCATGDTSSFVGPITFIMPLTNDFSCDAEMLNADGTVYTFNNTGATGTEGAIAPPATGAQTTTGWINSTVNNSTWFSFVAPASGQVRVNNTAINYNGQVAVYEMGDCLQNSSYVLMAANDNAIGGTSLAPNFTICGLTPGATYHLMHDGFNGTTGNYSISITPIVLEAGTAVPTTQVCTGTVVDLFTTISGNNAGGVWTSAIPAANVSINGSDFATAGLSYQVFNLQYRVTDGCAYDSIMTQVHVFGPSTAGADGVINTCRNQPIDLLAGLSGNADLEGTWYNPQNAALPNSQVITGNVPGQFNYDYIAGNGVCPNDTANVIVMVGNCDYLSVQEEVFEGVSIFPNPSKGTFFVANGSSAEAFDYTVTDANGRVLKAAQQAITGAATTEINLEGAQTGIYFIRLANSQAEKVFRVVIN